MARCSACKRIFTQPWRVVRAMPRIPDGMARQVLEQTVSGAFMVRGSDLWSGTRGHSHTAFARQVAMYLAHVAWGLSMTEVGQVFARDRTTVSYACGRVEDMRDDADFDRSLDLLESVLRALSLSSLPPLDRWRASL
jgi:hypothetical protein